MGELANLPNLGAASERMLIQAGITSSQQLRSLGAVAAYFSIKKHTDNASLNLLWALHGALEGCAWNQLTPSVKAELLMQLETLQEANQ